MNARADLLAGAVAAAPLLVGIVPFGLVTGVAGVNAGIPPGQVVAMSVVVFAGAAQLATIDLVGRTAPVAVVVLTAVVINLRMSMYSASIAPYFRRFSTPTRWLGAYVLTDQAYALSLAEYGRTTPAERDRWWFYLGVAASLWLTWQVATVAGVVLGSSIPAGLSLEFAVPLTFMALLFPVLDDRATEVAAVVAGGVGVAATVLPFDLGLVAASLVGILAGVLVEVRTGDFPTVAETDEGGDSASGDSVAGDSTTGGETG